MSVNVLLMQHKNQFSRVELCVFSTRVLLYMLYAMGYGLFMNAHVTVM